MNTVLSFFADQPILLLTVLLALGAGLGKIRIAGVRIGPAAVLFGAIAVSAIGVARGHTLEIPEVVGTLGLVMFTYTVGVIGGPNFFGSLRHGWKLMLGMVGIFIAVAGVGTAVGKALGLSMPVIAGSFAGALTNTPALAAAAGRAGDPAGPTVGYSITYIWGVIGMMLAASYVLHRSRKEDTGTEPLVHRTIRVDRANPTSLGDLAAKFDRNVTFTRLKHEHAANPTVLPEDEHVLQPRDLVTAVGPEHVVDEVTLELGHVSSHNIVENRRDLDYRRVTVSNNELAGLTIHGLGLEQRFGAVASRVRRGDIDLVAHPKFVVQMGDRIRVITPRDRMGQVSRFLGDSERGVSDINPTGLAIGMSLGILIGLVQIPFPGGGFAIGAPAGTLLVGLLFGRFGRIGPVITSMSNGAASSLSSFGMIIFLAYAGTRAGERFTGAVTSELGWKVAVVGFVITTLAAVGLLAMAQFAKNGMRQTAGMLGGAQTQPAVLAYANERSNFDVRVGVGYALVYPAAMISKILIAQILAGLP